MWDCTRLETSLCLSICWYIKKVLWQSGCLPSFPLPPFHPSFLGNLAMFSRCFPAGVCVALEGVVWMSMPLEALVFEHLAPSWWHYLGGFRRCLLPCWRKYVTGGRLWELKALGCFQFTLSALCVRLKVRAPSFQLQLPCLPLEGEPKEFSDGGEEPNRKGRLRPGQEPIHLAKLPT